MASSSYQPNPTADHAADHDGHGGHGHHITPLSTLLGVFGALVFLTILTVLFAHPDIKALIQWFVRDRFYDMSDAEVVRYSTHLAMLIASVKGILVALYFMHLRHDRPFNLMMFIFTVLIVALFIGYVLMDATQYTKNEAGLRTEVHQKEFWEQHKEEAVNRYLAGTQERESDGVPKPEDEGEDTPEAGMEEADPADDHGDHDHSDEDHSEDDEPSDEESADPAEPPAN